MIRLQQRLSAGLRLFLPLAVAAAAICADPPPATGKDLNEQCGMALAWMQSSAEYRELCYQAYNLAGMIVDKAVAGPKPAKPLAIIADLDEALIDNSAYNAGLVGTENGFSGKTWDQWEKAGLALAIPGAADFLNATKAKGVAVYYVTNRSQANLDATIKNLVKLDFPFADSGHILATAGSGDKQGRFDTVAKDHEVVLYMGDNANDLPIGTYHKGMKERNALVDANKAKFGTQFVVLPNPVYGDWEGALADKYFGLTPPQKDEARKAALRTWKAVP